MPQITLKQLEAFTAVVECGSFSRAAETLFLSQSTVSAHISTLEQILGQPLLQRADRHLPRLTAAGSRVYPMAKRVLADCEEMISLFVTENSAEPLLLGASTVPGQYLLPRYLAAYLKKHPQQHYHLRRGDSAEIHQLIRSGSVRLGFVGAKLEPEVFQYISLAQDTLVMVAPNNEHYRCLHQQGALGRELLAEPTVAREEGSGTDRTVQDYMTGIGFPKDQLHILARVDDPETIKQMVAQGVGVSVLSALAVAREVADGTLIAFAMDPVGLRRDIYLIYPKDMLLSSAEQRFVEFLKRL